MAKAAVFGKRVFKPMGVGNLVVSRTGDVVKFELNTFHQGQPFALFTVGELESLIKVLKGYSAPPTPEEDDDDNWSDLV